MRIQHNQSLFVQNRYNNTNTELNKTLNKLASGYQINKAGDDAAGLAISEKMRAQIRGLEQASENIQDGISVLNVMDGALGTMQSPMLNRLRELIIQAANDTNTDADRALIQKEVEEIIEGIDDIVHNTEFNTIKPLMPPSKSIPGTGSAGQADIIFIIDTTGSMEAQINHVKNNVSNFVSALKAHGIDVNLGLVTYGDESAIGDHTNPGGDRVKSQTIGFPFDVDQFKQQVGQIQLTNGFDWDESGLEGIMEAHKISNFRPSATKNYILVTDATVHERKDIIDLDSNGTIETNELQESYKYSHYKVNEVAEQLKTDGVKLTVITNNESNSQLSPLHTETDGLYLDINGMFGEQLMELAEKITNESGGMFTEETLEPLIIHSGANAGQNIEIPLYDHRDFRLFLKDMALTPYEAAMEALDRVDAVIAKISDRRAEYGAISNPPSVRIDVVPS